MDNETQEELTSLPRIGVYDYESCVRCLTSNWKKVFPQYPPTDPQDMIQRMAWEIQNLRRGKAPLWP
jgi:hypothetical protein